MEGGESRELMLMRRALDNYSGFIEHQYWNLGKSLTAELQQIGEDLAALVEITAIDSGLDIERRHKLFYRGKIDRGQGGEDEAPLASVGGIIVDLHDNVVSRFSYMVPAEYISNKILFEYVCFIRAIKHALEKAFIRDLIVYGDSSFITIITASLNCMRRRLLPTFVRLGHLHLHSQASSHMMKFHGLSYYWASCHGSHMIRAAEEATEAINRQRLMKRDENENGMSELCTVCFKDVDKADMVYVPNCFHRFCRACALVDTIPTDLPACPCKGCPTNLPLGTPLFCPNCLAALPSPQSDSCPHCWAPVTLFFAWLSYPLLNSFF